MTAQTASMGSTASRPRLSPRRWRRLREISLGYALLAPALLLLIVFEFFPVGYGLYISLCNWSLRCNQFIGLDNYTRALGDPEMWSSLLTTVVYAVISIPLQLGLGLFL